MDDHTSSDGTSSSESFASSRTSSSPRPEVHRPQQPRQYSDTHIFSANSIGLSTSQLKDRVNSAKSRAALRELLNPTMSSYGSDDRARLLNSGLQWLLETSTTPPPRTPTQGVAPTSVPLSHEAIGTFNSENERGGTGHGNTPNGARFGSRSTRAWLDKQVKTDVSPPL